ncbi:MAG: O-antigen ligase, partial [Pseudomonadota bacterium]
RMDALDLIAAAFGTLALLVIWTQAEPFKSLQGFGSLDDPTQGNAVRKLVTLGLVGTSACLVLLRGQLGRTVRIASPALVVVMLWFGLSALLSENTGLAINRLVLAACTILIAGLLPLLFRRLDTFMVVLGLAASIAVAFSYLGIVFAPDLSIHTLKDVYGHDLEGSWRGVFAHKNELGAMAIHFAFIGLLLARTGRPAWGTVLAVASLVLLVMSNGKTAMILILPTFLVGLVVAVFHMRTLSAILSVGLIGGLLLLTLGSIVFDPIRDIVKMLMSDPTFTGRTDIWELGMLGARDALWMGYGYATFWDSGQAIALVENRPVIVFDAHNGYVETVLSGGVIGLFLVMLWAGFEPWRAIERIKRRMISARERTFLVYVTQVWMFTLLVSALESVLFNRGQSVWFMGLLAIMCLRHWECATRPARTGAPS